MWKGWSPSRKLAAAAVAVVAVIAIAVAVSSGRGGSSKASTDAGKTTSTTGSGSTGGSSGGSTSSAAASTDGGGSAPDSPGSGVIVPSAQLPLTADVSNTKGLKDGDVVTITVKADKGSTIYGVEMRMCKAGTKIGNDGDMLPTVTGQCASKGLSTGADGYKIVAGEPPFQQVTATYKVGTGTDSYEMDDGTTGTVTCDSSHPCELAVKYQIPNGFGFRTYPLTFS